MKFKNNKLLLFGSICAFSFLSITTLSLTSCKQNSFITNDDSSGNSGGNNNNQQENEQPQLWHVINNKSKITIKIKPTKNAEYASFFPNFSSAYINNYGEIDLKIGGAGLPSNLQEYNIQSNILNDIPLRVKINTSSPYWTQLLFQPGYFVNVENGDLLPIRIELYNGNKLTAYQEIRPILKIHYEIQTDYTNYKVYYALTKETKQINGYSDILKRALNSSNLPYDIKTNLDVLKLIKGEKVYTNGLNMPLTLFLTSNDQYENIQIFHTINNYSFSLRTNFIIHFFAAS